MLLWIILFILIIIISLILAYQSMKDFQDKPEKLGSQYAPFLIRNTTALTEDLLKQLHNEIFKKGQLISLERLFKGLRSALIIYGPKEILVRYSEPLKLIELEDYTGVNIEHLSVWEVGVKELTSLKENLPNLFKELPQLLDQEQFWWQLVLRPKSRTFWHKLVNLDFLKKPAVAVSGHAMTTQKIAGSQGIPLNFQQSGFQCHIRAALITSNLQRKFSLVSLLERIGSGRLVKLPRPYSLKQTLEMYKERSFPYIDSRLFVLEPGDILRITLKPNS